MSCVIITVGLGDLEREQLQSWVRRIASSVDFRHVGMWSQLGPLEEGLSVCLGVLRLLEGQYKPWREVSMLRRRLPDSAPLLVLIPEGQSALIRRCVKAGADDYWILPFNEEVFMPRLQVLLEWAAATETARGTRVDGDRDPGEQQKGAWLMSLLEEFFQKMGGEGSLPRTDSTLLGGRWKMIRNLGGGSYGEVWQVEHFETGERAVAKIPHSIKSNPRFMQEASILKCLADHPHSVRLLEIAHDGGKVVLIQEFADGKTLQELLEEGMEGREKETAFLQLVQVLAYAHDQNIMHRDIKPDNIIVQASGGLKLLDFGTGKHLSGESSSSTIIGSRPYMSPEQINGRSCLASDVWALGVILYALATGLIPFYYDNDKALMDAILDCEPDRPSTLEEGISPELERVILKCLEKKPENRYGTAGELLGDLLKTFPSFGDGEVLKF